MAENKAWASDTLKEVPFWHEGMTVEEYEEERVYFYQNIDEVKKGTYVPLWKQK